MMAVNNRPEGKKQSVLLVIADNHVGEMSAEETEILVDPSQRVLNQLTVEDTKAATALFSDLMGSAVVPRKRFIQVHSKEAQYGI